MALIHFHCIPTERIRYMQEFPFCKSEQWTFRYFLTIFDVLAVPYMLTISETFIIAACAVCGKVIFSSSICPSVNGVSRVGEFQSHCVMR